MKKKVLWITIILSIILITTIHVQAQSGGGTGGSGGGSNGSIGGDSSTLYDCGGGSNNRNAFLIELVYYNGSSREILGSTVVLLKGNHTSTMTNAVNSYANNYTTTKKIITDESNPFYTLSKCSNDKNCTYEQLEQQGWFDQNLNADIVIQNLNIPKSKMTRTHDKPYGINKKGYRILVQRLTAWCATGRDVVRVYPRKAAAKENWTTANGGGDFLNGSLSSAQPDLETSRHDIGIYAGSNYSWSKENFADYNKGVGYNIAWFQNKYSNQEYSIDAACEDCEGNNLNGSYYIQDITDWEAILSSSDSTNTNAKKYYKKTIGSCTVYCREEYKITYPNANNQISVEPGRYFTINKLGGSMYAIGVPNLKQIKITKIRECRTTGSNQKQCLASFASAAKKQTTKTDKTGSSAGDVGTITLTYKENYEDSKYNKSAYENIELKESTKRTITKENYLNTTVSNSNIMLKSTVTKYFELPEDTFRWINIRDGISSFKKPTEGLKHYLDVETSNLPVSVKNTSEIAGTITLNYSLPTNADDPYTLIKTAFNKNNNYFISQGQTAGQNIYSKSEQISTSACAKLFGKGTKKYNTCVSERKTNAAGKCYNQIVNQNKYTCDIKMCPEEGCDKDDDNSNGNSSLKCQYINDTYYGKKGQIVTKTEYEKECPNLCQIVGNKYYGQNGTEVTKEEYLSECPQTCKKVENKYYGKKGQIVTKNQYEEECKNNFCTTCDGGKCCPDLDMVCPDSNGECPSRGNTIIYRPIDLTNPFPGQTNYQRATGDNWCSYNMKTGKINCKNTNNVATTHIQKGRNTENENIYDLTPLYEVNLDATTIKNIRKYNQTHEYDDFTLDCTNKKTCYSTFLRETLNITGTCANKADATTCAESRR